MRHSASIAFNVGITDCVSACVADRSPYIGCVSPPQEVQRCAFPNLYRHYSGNNDEENNSLPSTEEAPDEPPPVIGELGCDLVTSQDGHILRPEMNFLELRHRFNTKATSAGDQVGGTDVWYIDTPPNSECPVHRTIGLDFLVQIMGKMEVTHFIGDQQIIRPGHLTIRGSSFTKWRNPSRNQWARMMGFMPTARSIGKKIRRLEQGFPSSEKTCYFYIP